MVATARIEYVAGGWPGERYTGSVKVSVNVEELAPEGTVTQFLKCRAVQKIAESYVMSRSQVKITKVTLLLTKTLSLSQGECKCLS